VDKLLKNDGINNVTSAQMSKEEALNKLNSIPINLRKRTIKYHQSSKNNINTKKTY